MNYKWMSQTLLFFLFMLSNPGAFAAFPVRSYETQQSCVSENEAVTHLKKVFAAAVCFDNFIPDRKKHRKSSASHENHHYHNSKRHNHGIFIFNFGHRDRSYHSEQNNSNEFGKFVSVSSLILSLTIIGAPLAIILGTIAIEKHYPYQGAAIAGLVLGLIISVLILISIVQKH